MNDLNGGEDRAAPLARSQTATGETEAATVLTKLVDALRRNRIDYVLLGDTRAYPRSIPSDVDIAIRTRSHSDLRAVALHVSLAAGFRVISWNEHASHGISIYIDDGPTGSAARVFTLDFYRDVFFEGRRLISASSLIEGSQDRDGLAISTGPSAFAYYFAKRVLKGQIGPGQASCLAAMRHDAPAEIDRWIERMLGSPLGKQWSRLLAAGAEPIPASLIEQSKAILERRFPVQLGHRLRSIGRALDRFRRPTGLAIAVLGPDGSGKTTVIDTLQAQPLDPFRHAVYRHLVPLPKKSGASSAPVVNPHDQVPRGAWAGTMKLAFLVAINLFGYLRFTLPALMSTKLVIFDRYFYDIAVDPRRYRHSGPCWLLRIAEALVPAPDLMFVLVADAEIIQARVQEVPMEETRAQVARYRALAQRFGFVRLVDASAPPDIVVSQIMTGIRDFMAARADRRLRDLGEKR